jgi:hypothetical protein
VIERFGEPTTDHGSHHTWKLPHGVLLVVDYARGKVSQVNYRQYTDLSGPSSRSETKNVPTPLVRPAGSYQSGDFCVPTIEAYTEPGPWYAPERNTSAWSEIMVHNDQPVSTKLYYSVILGDKMRPMGTLELLPEDSQTIKVENPGPEVPGTVCFENRGPVTVSGTKYTLSGDRLGSLGIQPVSIASLRSQLNQLLRIPSKVAYLDLYNPSDRSVRFALCWKESQGNCSGALSKIVEPGSAQRVMVPKDSLNPVVYIADPGTNDPQVPFAIWVELVEGQVKTFSTESGIRFGDTVKP